jgi:hypothetical protein
MLTVLHGWHYPYFFSRYEISCLQGLLSILSETYEETPRLRVRVRSEGGTEKNRNIDASFFFFLAKK